MVVGKLRAHLLGRCTITAISKETLRQILHVAGGVSWQTTTTWKASTDPDFITKMHRILDLYDHQSTDGRVVCVDHSTSSLVRGNPCVRRASRNACARHSTATTG